MAYSVRFATFALFAAVLAMAQTSTSITLQIVPSNSPNTASNSFILAQNGVVTPLGNSTLVATSSSWPVVSDGNGGATIGGPAQIGASLNFNLVDSIAFSFSIADPNFLAPQTFTMSGGTITGGTGKYGGATGSITLTVAKDSIGAFYSTSTTTGSGSITVGGNTTPLTLVNFRGWAGALASVRERDFSAGTLTVSGSLGNGTGTIVSDFGAAPAPTFGSGTLVFNGTDQMNFVFNYTPVVGLNPPASFNGRIAGGTGKYVNADGPLTFSTNNSGFGVSGTLITQPANAPVITQVKTAFGLPQISYNTWLQINGTNLVPTDTPSIGVDWSNAPDFANGKMPTQLGPISVTIGGLPGYVYFYCSAATDPNCTSGDQINVLAPFLALGMEGPAVVLVNNNGVSSAPFTVFRSRNSPTFFTFDAIGHVVARHLDSSLMGPATLYPGLSTPAKAGETIVVVGSGFGPPTTGGLVQGSATQSGPLNPAALSCFIGPVSANTVAALVGPGLYQFNITIPKNTPSGDNLLNCVFNVYPTFPGTLIAVQ